jgi:S1-C subfamily serine protease
MNRSFSFAAALLVASALNATAQQRTEPQVKVRVPEIVRIESASRYPGFGFGVSSNGTARDTLGVLINLVNAGSAAEKAGLEEGNRIAAINGVNLRLSAADVGDPDMGGIMGRRLQRELQKVKAGDAVELRVWQNGQFKTVQLQSQDREQLPGRVATAKVTARASIGATIGGSNSSRDTLGVFVASVVEQGPLAKAGIYEGSRIASINGVDVRVSAADAGDELIATTRVNRLMRAIEKLEPGAKVELRIWQNGQYRNVTVEAAKRSDVYKDDPMGGSFFFNDGTGSFNLRGLDQLGHRLNAIKLFPDGQPPRVRIEPPAIDMQLSPEMRDKIKGTVDDQVQQLRQRLEELMQQLRTGDGLREQLQKRIDTLQQELQRARPTSRGAAATSMSLETGEKFNVAVQPALFESTRTADLSGLAGTFTSAGMQLMRVSPALASYFGAGSENGLLVLRVDSTMPGIEKGDVVMSVDSRLTKDWNPRTPIITAGAHTVDVLRGREHVVVTVIR